MIDEHTESSNKSLKRRAKFTMLKEMAFAEREHKAQIDLLMGKTDYR